MMNSDNKHAQSGFTLLELLVAIAVFAILSIMAYGTLSNILRAQSQTRETAEELHRLQQAILHIERDMMQIVVRPIRDEYREPRHSLVGEEMGPYRLEFTRTGRSNPMEAPRSYLQRVAYVIPLDEENKLYRYVWPSLDRSQEPAVHKTLLLDGVEELSMSFYDNQDEEIKSWPPTQDQSNQPNYTAMPRAIRFSLKLKGMGDVNRLIIIPQGAL